VRFRSGFDLIKATVSSWMEDFAPSMGAALAYYTVFSVAPLLVIVIAVAALIFGQEAAQAGIMEQARGLLGPEGATAIEAMLVNAQRPKEGAVASILGIAALLIGATTVFAELESNLNRIWKVARRQESGLWSFVRGRILSVGMILAIAFCCWSLASARAWPLGESIGVGGSVGSRFFFMPPTSFSPLQLSRCSSR
jgi:membrane protein